MLIDVVGLGDLSIWILGFVSNFEFRYSDLHLRLSLDF